MPQKRKKKNNTAQQKVMQAQHRNEHIRRLRNIFVQLNDLPFYSLLSKQAVEKVYAFRGAPMRVIAAGGCNIPKGVIEAIEYHVKVLLNTTSLELFENGPSISFSDYYYIGMTLDVFLMDDAPFLKECSPNFDLSKAGPDTRKFLEYQKKRNSYFVERLSSTLDLFAHVFGDLSQKLYYIFLESDIYLKDKNDFRRYTYIEINAFTPARKPITIDGITRPAIQVCWKTNTYQAELKFTAKQLALQDEYPADTLFEVYIQPHALNRLSERIDSISPGIMHFDMVSSLAVPAVRREKNGDFLFEFHIFNLKAGYFRATMIDRTILIRTFLFLTNSGTPEGRRLEKLTGLQMLDKKYLAIDRLSALIHSDVWENEEVSALFRQAGCGSLLDLCPKLKESSFWEHPEQNIEIADRMLEYMQKGREASLGIEEYREEE